MKGFMALGHFSVFIWGEEYYMHIVVYQLVFLTIMLLD